MRSLMAVAALAAGCNLVGTNTLSVPYSFDPQEYMKSLGQETGASFPKVDCSTAADCAQASQTLPMGSSLTASCDPTAKSCRATTELRLSYPINLSMQSSFPQSALQLGIDFVDIAKIEYWVASNTITVPTPAIDLYVAPASAKDESMGTHLGSIAPLAAKSANCKDPPDTDAASGTAMVCDMPLDQAGKDQLAAFAKDYKNEFQIIAHATISAKGGDPLPAGAIDFVVRPVIAIGIVR
jgi:hypothetical protein